MDPLIFLAQLQEEARAGASGQKRKSPDFHYGLNAWVDDNSSLAKALRKLAEESGAEESRVEYGVRRELGAVGEVAPMASRTLAHYTARKWKATVVKRNLQAGAWREEE